MQQALETLKDRLSNINRRDRSLKLLKIIKKKSFDVSQFSKILKSIQSKQFELGTKDEHPGLYPLVKDLEFLQAETGQSECYIGYPFIEGVLQDGTVVRCPILLQPVTVTYKKKKFIVASAGDIQINKTLFIALERFEDAGIELDELATIQTIEQAIELLQSHKKEIVESKEYTEYKSSQVFSSFKELSDKDIEKLESKQTLTLQPYCVLGQFAQNTSALSYDYHRIIREQISNQLLDTVFGKQLEYDELSEFKDYPVSNAQYVYIPDASQEQVLEQAKKSNLVIQGPPGTGKSQVITNIISDAISKRQRVMVVSEKRAALDVVYNRLSGVGLSSQLLLVHNASQDRQDVCTKINSVLSEYTSGSVAAQIEAVDVDTPLSKLNQIVSAMHKILPIGVSLYDLYVSTDADNTDTLSLTPEEVASMTNDSLIELQHIASQMQSVNQLLEHHPIATRHSFDSIDESELKKSLAKAAQTVSKVYEKLDSKEFIKDLSLLHEQQPASKEVLLQLNEWLEYYNKYKDAPIRLANPKYVSISKKLKKVIRERDLKELTARWNDIKPELELLELQLKDVSVFFKPELAEKIWLAIVLYDNPHRIFEDISKALESYDLLRQFDRLTSIQKNLILKCLQEFPDKEWGQVLHNSFGLKWIKEHEPEDVHSFTTKMYVESQKQIISLLQEKTKQVPLTILSQYKEHAQSLSAQADAKQLLHDVSKKRNKPSLRKLFDGHDIMQFFPCILCSPDTVSSMLPLDTNLFDIIIFDEASQCKIERAIPSILRGRKLIVAGDDQQLPPTSFFQNTDDTQSEDEEYAEVLEDDSLLSRCRTVFPTRRLLSHYRALYPQLIQFSNYAFYNGSLQVLPTPSPKVCMDYNYVKGVWKLNKNEPEAKKVIDVLKQLHKSHKNQTYGIITFNQKQREYIQQLLDEQASKSTEFGTWVDEQLHRYEHGEYVGLFVKNIENVQGDERDHIIFSIAYGPDEKGKIRYNFGPLNGTYGPNRLNVAISRAKEHIHFCTSIKPSEFSYSSDQQGPKLLGEYIKYVHAVSEGKSTSIILETIAQLQDMSISQEQKRGFETELKGEKEVGTIGYPIPVAQKNTAILSDYTYYHTSKTAKERDIYKQLALQSRGWDVKIVWARDKWRKSL